MKESMQLRFVALLSLVVCTTVRAGHPARSLLSDANHHFAVNDPIPLWANKIGPFSNPSEAYEYYRLPFCKPDGGVRYKILTHVGELIDSNRDASTPYELPFRVDRPRTSLCYKSLTNKEVAAFRRAVKEDWYFQMYYDFLPIWGFIGKVEKILNPGGTDFRYCLFTHMHFDIHYNGDNVVEVNVATDPSHCVDVSEDTLGEGSGAALEVEFTYSAKWQESHISFAKRLERYEKVPRNPIHLEIHWFSIINSCVTVLLLTGFLATILMRVLKNDFVKFSSDEQPLEDEESGWKYVHGDVFRFPPHKSLFCAFVGCGTQLFYLTMFLFGLALIGVFYPYNRGLVYTAQIVLYAMTAGISGYTSSLLYRQMEGTRWVHNILLTCTVFSGPFFVVFAVLNTVAIAYRSMAALPAGTIVVIIIIWALVTVPLTVFLAITGKNSRAEFDAPCRTNKYPREVPDLPWYRTTLPQMAMAGFLPFSAIYVELYYVFASVWGHKVYIIWSILFLVFLILIVVTAFITVALTYFQLAVEDHRWWWRSFLCGGSTGVFVYGYCFYYYKFRSEMSGFMQTSFFFGYMGIACYGLFIMLGTVGWRASMMFVRRIYRAIKCD